MVSFKRMWEDVNSMVESNNVKNVDIVENYNSGFMVKEGKDTTFVNKEDFVDVWCKMLYFNKVSEEDINTETPGKVVYNMIKSLPYIDEKEGILELVE